MRTFIDSLSEEMKAAVHGNQYLQYSTLLAVPGLILTIGVIVLFILFFMPGPKIAPQNVSSLIVEVTKTPFQPQWTGTTSPYCYGSETHTIGKGIAEKFNLPYEQVMTWFCSGNEFEDILLALQTRQKVEVPVEQMLALKVEGYTWEGIWRQVGLTE
jgi:hypothetical protein